MKVEYKKKEFEPVNIVLESEEDVIFMWHYFNKPNNCSWNSYRESNCTNVTHDTYEIWEMFDKITNEYNIDVKGE
jgi:hypothetical protein